jgi:tRNA(fMet)-specific endonuclease VapC
MSMYLLDTDTVSLFQHGHAAVCAAIAKHSPSEIGITVLTVEEQLSGWYKELRQAKKAPALAAVYQRMAQTVRFYAVLPIFTLTEAAIGRYADLKRLKLKVGRTDLRIAAIVLQENAVLVTANVQDFKQIPGLHIEDWSKQTNPR